MPKGGGDDVKKPKIKRAILKIKKCLINEVLDKKELKAWVYHTCGG